MGGRKFGCLLALGGAVAFGPAVRAADLYKFSTPDATLSPDDGYDTSVVSVTAGPSVGGPANGADLAAGNVGLSRFWNSEWAGFSLSAGNGETLESGEFGSGYFQFTLSGLNGAKLKLSSLNFNSARGGGEPATQNRGFKLYAAPNGQAMSFADVPVLDLPNETGTRAAAMPQVADLSGAAFQDVSSVTFRYYPLTPATGNTMDFSGFTVTGTVVAAPEPGSAAVIAGGLLVAGGLGRRRRRA